MVGGLGPVEWKARWREGEKEDRLGDELGATSEPRMIRMIP